MRNLQVSGRPIFLLRDASHWRLAARLAAPNAQHVPVALGLCSPRAVYQIFNRLTMIKTAAQL